MRAVIARSDAHGVFAPNHRLREQVTPARRGRRKTQTSDEPAPARHVSMTWAQRLKRVFKIDILTCEHCGGAVKVIASIEDSVVIKKILDHLARRAEAATAPPLSGRFSGRLPDTKARNGKAVSNCLCQRPWYHWRARKDSNLRPPSS